MRVLAIASAGGHWIQLLRLEPAFDGHELIYISTKQEFDTMVGDKQFYLVPDANRKNKLNLIKNLIKVGSIISKLKPDVIITTGAAPGLMGIVIGRLMSVKTIWIDSIANSKTLSLSGKIASRFAHRTYTQWPELATDKIFYAGNIF